MRSSVEIYDIATGRNRVVWQTASLMEAPNFAPDGRHLLINGEGRLYRLPLDGGAPVPVDTGFAERCNNDHGVSPDGRWLAVRLDLPAIAAALGLHTRIAPRVLRLDPVHRPGDAGVMLAPGQRDLDILANTLTPERHLGYAVQWFGLALAALVTAAVLTSRSRPR